jgi:hypothetical protein
VVTGLCIVQPHAVHEHQHLAEVGAANGEVTLDPAHAAHAHVDRRGQAKHVGDRLHRQTLDLLAGDDGHGARDAAQFDRSCGARHDNSLPKPILGGRAARPYGRHGDHTGDACQTPLAQEHPPAAAPAILTGRSYSAP